MELSTAWTTSAQRLLAKRPSSHDILHIQKHNHIWRVWFALRHLRFLWSLFRRTVSTPKENLHFHVPGHGKLSQEYDITLQTWVNFFFLWIYLEETIWQCKVRSLFTSTPNSHLAFLHHPHIQPRSTSHGSDHGPCPVGQLKSQKSLKSLRPLKEQWAGCHIALTFHKGIPMEVTGISHKAATAGCLPKKFFSSTTGSSFGDGPEFSLLPTIFTNLINSLSSLLKLSAEFGHSLDEAFLLEKIPPIWYETLSDFKKTGTNLDIWVPQTFHPRKTG